ncbi:hypothetical protein [Aliiroseovarius marinus]|uniref:hypothetical protein n=1 Tax=Aliiroseovarius marinus TaxID=2500159 RepID=UPI00105B6664|nr:hypothetical protein [Aliiroseovarius marinus]
MEEITQQLLYQRLRNRVIELFEVVASVDAIARFGAFEIINLTDDLLPLDYDDAPYVFSARERNAVLEFLKLVDLAANTVHEDTQDVAWLKRSREWVNLSKFAEHAVAIFTERGRLSEETEEDLSSFL